MNLLPGTPILGVFALFCTNLANGDGYWNTLVSGQFYKDFKLAHLDNRLIPFYISKDSEIAAKLQCGRACGSNTACQAFNLYLNGTFYVCEQLATNLWLNQSQIAFVSQPGGLVWEKLPRRAALPFIDQTLKGVVPANYCETIRRGCNGNWPDCTNCVQSCIDCKSRYNYTGTFTCTMWPGPAGPENTPIVTSCYNKLTHLVRRRVDLITGQVKDHHILPFRDMNRLCHLNVYKILQFFFVATNNPWSYQSFYANPYIYANGTLSGLTFLSSNVLPSNVSGDGLALGTNTLTPSPFAVVNDDRYSCGSFWLFNNGNATYCPGGGVSFFGKPQMNNSKVTDTGIHWPPATADRNVLKSMDLALYIL